MIDSPSPKKCVRAVLNWIPLFIFSIAWNAKSMLLNTSKIALTYLNKL